MFSTKIYEQSAFERANCGRHVIDVLKNPLRPEPLRWRQARTLCASQ